MRSTLPVAVAAVMALPLISGTGPAEYGEQMPALEAIKWYNTPPLSAEDMGNKAVFVEIFRTW